MNNFYEYGIAFGQHISMCCQKHKNSLIEERIRLISSSFDEKEVDQFQKGVTTGLANKMLTVVKEESKPKVKTRVK